MSTSRTRKLSRQRDLGAVGAIVFIVVWLIGVVLTIGFWGLVAYVLFKFAETL